MRADNAVAAFRVGVEDVKGFGAVKCSNNDYYLRLCHGKQAQTIHEIHFHISSTISSSEDVIEDETQQSNAEQNTLCRRSTRNLRLITFNDPCNTSLCIVSRHQNTNLRVQCPIHYHTMDIDDILADLDHEHIPQESQDLQSLTRSWVAERVAPELLPWPEELMDRVLARIAKQVCHNRRKRVVAPKLTLEVLPDRNHRRPDWFHGP
jgi:hypothetical protein